MARHGIATAVGIVAGIVAVYLLPPPWLAPLSAIAAICCAISAIIVRCNTKTEPPSNPTAGILLSVLNLPDRPFAPVKEDRALTTFLALAAFLASLCLSVMVRALA
jgi:uncharacterized membrane protein YfcA